MGVVLYKEFADERGTIHLKIKSNIYKNDICHYYIYMYVLKDRIRNHKEISFIHSNNYYQGFGIITYINKLCNYVG